MEEYVFSCNQREGCSTDRLSSSLGLRFVSHPTAKQLGQPFSTDKFEN